MRKMRLRKILSLFVVVTCCTLIVQQGFFVFATNNEQAVKAVDGTVNVTANVSNKNPYSGETFDVTLLINSVSTSEEEYIENLTVDFTIPNSVEYSSGPVSNSQYTVTKNGNNIQIKYLQGVSFGSLKSLKFTMYVKEGVSTPINTSFEGVFQVSGNNVVAATAKTPVVTPINTAVPTIMSLETINVDPTLIHTAKIKLEPEKFVGGLNHLNSKVRIDFPDDIQLFEILYDGTKYAVAQDGNGKKYCEIPIPNFNVATGADTIEVTYSYPPLADSEPKTYDIVATYTATRYNDEPVTETKTITETLVPGDSDGQRYFVKTGQETITKIPREGLSFALTFLPGEDFNNVSIIDDPVRGGESNFFDALKYESITWDAQRSYDPAITGKVRTQLVYETANEPGVWKKYGMPSEAGVVSIKNLNLDSNDYVTKIRFDFYNASGTRVILKNSGQVYIRLYLSAKDGITSTDAALSYVQDSKITNSAYIVGDIKKSGGYEAIEDNGVNNKKTADVKVEPAKTLIGYERWENYNAFSKNPIEVGEAFSYTARPVAFNLDIEDAIMYIEISDPDIEVTNITFAGALKGFSYENVEYEMKKTSGGIGIKINFNNTVPVSGWGSSAWVKVDGIAKPGTAATVSFRSAMSSGNASHPFQYPTNTNIQGFGSVRIGSNMATSYLAVTKSLAMNTRVESSVDDVIYKLTNTTEALGGEAEGIYKITLENPQNSTSNYDKSIFIVSLPRQNDLLVTSDIPKKSTVTPQITKITNEDGTLVEDGSISFFYSLDATPEKNNGELQDFSNVQSTWITWDGQSPLPSNAVAVKIVNDKEVKPDEKIGYKLHASFDGIGENVEVAWLSVATGAIMGGDYTIPGEPTKAGIYLSNLPSDKELKGIIWEDEDANGLRESSEKRLGGIEVRLYDWDNNYIGATQTNDNGEYHFVNLYAKKYRVEFDTPLDYNLTNMKEGSDLTIDSNFEADALNEKLATTTVNLATETNPTNIDAGIYTTASIGDYVWLDIDSNGQQDAYETGIAGVELKLYRVETSGDLIYVGAKMTDSNGAYLFKDLKPGNYKIEASQIANHEPTRERAAGVDIAKASSLGRDYKTPNILVPSGSQNKQVDLGYRLTPYGAITVTKEGDNQVLEGATFGIWAEGVDISTEPLSIQTTNEEGKLSFIQLPVGTYQIKEIAAPVGYDLDSTIHTETISESLLFIDVTYTNVLSKAMLNVEKVDEEGSPLAGATFSIYDGSVSESNLVATSVSDEAGKIQFKNLEQKTYILVETKAPEGYVLDETHHPVVFDRTTLSKTAIIENQLDLGQIVINKVDENGDPLANASFALYKKSEGIEGSPIAIMKSDENGKITFENLEQTSYLIKEIEAPEGYTLSEDVHEITVDKSNLERTIEVVNFKKTIVEKPEEPEKEANNSGEDKEESAVGETAKGTATKTGDETPYPLYVLLIMSLATIIYSRYREKE